RIAYRRRDRGGGRRCARRCGWGAASTAISVNVVVRIAVPVAGLESEARPPWARERRISDRSCCRHDPTDQQANGEEGADSRLEGIPPNHCHTTLLSTGDESVAALSVLSGPSSITCAVLPTSSVRRPQEYSDRRQGP